MPLKMEDIKVGDKLKADGGFTCIEEGRVCDVKADDKGNLYVDCCGTECDFRTEVDDRDDPKDFTYTEQHRIDGQEDENGTLIGFEKVAA
jgi:hypothetical protein